MNKVMYKWKILVEFKHGDSKQFFIKDLSRESAILKVFDCTKNLFPNNPPIRFNSAHECL